MQLLADGLALVYHEARHVRHLIKPGFLAQEGWERFTSLPADRVDAWRAMQPLRDKAAAADSPTAAASVFTTAFHKDLDHLNELYANVHWRHASAVGGHAWRGATQAVSDLVEALNQHDNSVVANATESLLKARHNNGSIAAKILGLDDAIEVPTNPAWHASRAGA